jgi:pimeloyl-ACP methyl ester carboxylesterase
MSCTENYTHVNGVNLCWFEWEKKAQGNGTILFVHATGFHARCWDKVIDRLPGRHIISIDMRGHGRSDNTFPFSWDNFGSDLTEFIKALQLKDVIGIGHSMGGHSLTQAAANVPGVFTSLVLVDPVIMAPEIYGGEVSEHSGWLSEEGEHPVARRKNFFADADAMFANFKGRGSYGLWREDVLMDYCTYGLVPNPEGDGFVLACPPQVEAAIYMGSAGMNIYDQIHKIEIPVRILRAKPRDSDRQEMDFSTSPTWEGLASEFAQGTDIYLPELTHFIPMQDPELVARHILESKG